MSLPNYFVNYRVGPTGATGATGASGSGGSTGATGPTGTYGPRDAATIFRTAYSNVSSGSWSLAIITQNTYTLCDIGTTTTQQIGSNFSFPNSYTIKYLGPSAVMVLTLQVSAGTYIAAGDFGFFIAVNGTPVAPGIGLNLSNTVSRTTSISIYRTLATNDEVTAYSSGYSSTNDVAFYMFTLQVAAV